MRAFYEIPSNGSRCRIDQVYERCCVTELTDFPIARREHKSHRQVFLGYHLNLATTQGQSHEKTYPCLFSAFRELRLGGLAKDW